MLIVQFRTTPTKEQEQQCFLAEYPDYKDRIDFVSVITDELPTDLSPYAGVIVAGSAKYCLSKGDGEGTWREPTFAFMQKVMDKGLPLLGICFGFQMLAVQQGAKIARIEEAKQSGTFMSEVLPAAENDPVLGHLPNPFKAVYAHQDIITDLPAHLLPTAKTERVQCTSFKIEGRQAWGVLYHPELDGERIRERLMMVPEYAGGYMGDTTIDDVVAMFDAAPESKTILHTFAELAFAGEDLTE